MRSWYLAASGLILASSLLKAQQRPGTGGPNSSSDSRLAKRLTDAIEGAELWRAYWTSTDVAERGPRNAEATQQVMVSETPTFAGVCVVESGLCGVVSWGSDGRFHVRMSERRPTLTDKTALARVSELAALQSNTPRARAGDFTSPVSGEQSAVPRRTFSQTIERVGWSSYLDASHQGAMLDEGLLIAAKRHGLSFRGAQCSDGQIAVPWVLASDEYAYVELRFAGCGDGGFLLFRRDLLGRWLFEKLVVSPLDVTMLLVKSQPIKREVAGLGPPQN
jgi:hypothetical protein